MPVTPWPRQGTRSVQTASNASCSDQPISAATSATPIHSRAGAGIGGGGWPFASAIRAIILWNAARAFSRVARSWGPLASIALELPRTVVTNPRRRSLHQKPRGLGMGLSPICRDARAVPSAESRA
jgi:hypothetical protein